MKPLLVLLLIFFCASDPYAQVHNSRRVARSVPYFEQGLDDSLQIKTTPFFEERFNDSLQMARARAHHIKKVTITAYVPSDSIHTTNDTALHAIRSEIFSFDRNGNRLEHVFNHIDGSQSIEQRTYTRTGNIQTVTYRNMNDNVVEDTGHVLTTYDTKGRVIKSETIRGNVDSKKYEVGPPSYSSMAYTYDAQGRLVHMQENLNHARERVWDFKYDKQGRRFQKRLTLNGGDVMTVTTYTYDWFGRPLIDSEINKDGDITLTKRSYDSAGNFRIAISHSATNVMGPSAKYYDRYGHLTFEEIQDPLSEGEAPERRYYSYDEAGNPIEIINGNDTTRYHYRTDETLAEQTSVSKGRSDLRITYNNSGLPVRVEYQPDIIIVSKQTSLEPTELRYSYEYY